MTKGKTVKKKTVKRPVKKKKPSFNVPNLGHKKQVKPRWRKPRGTHNKKRMKRKFFGASPRIGYKNKKEVRGLHARGQPEKLVSNMKELEELKDKGVLVRLAAAIGKRKRKLMEEKAKAMDLVIINLAQNGHPPKKDEPKTKGA